VSDLGKHQFVTYVDELISVPQVRWLPDIADESRTRLAFTSLVAQLSAVQAGAGLAMLPHFMVHGRTDLVRVLPKDANLVRDWWLVVHQDLQQVPRIRAAIEFIIEVMRRDKTVLLG
jgi:DNA-binding transcriptional LysR family regulator